MHAGPVGVEEVPEVVVLSGHAAAQHRRAPAHTRREVLGGVVAVETGGGVDHGGREAPRVGQQRVIEHSIHCLHGAGGACQHVSKTKCGGEEDEVLVIWRG